VSEVGGEKRDLVLRSFLLVFIFASVVEFESAYWEISSLILRSCSYLVTAVIGDIGELRTELELSAALCLATGTSMVTGGIAELARLSLPFSNLAFNSAAVALICVGRGAVGAMACSMF
jgi:hypothetical protein